MFRWFLSNLHCSVIGDGRGDVFFRRYKLFKSRWLSIFLHEFFRGDRERCLHDHPWAFLSVVLRGGYWEEMWMFPDEPGWTIGVHGKRPTVKRWRGPGSILWRPANTAHRIDLEPGTNPWSLVFVGPKTREWGFHTVFGWRPWESGQPNPICEIKGE